LIIKRFDKLGTNQVKEVFLGYYFLNSFLPGVDYGLVTSHQLPIQAQKLSVQA
jgi:hypothetical protein